MQQLLFATHNCNKASEIQKLLHDKYLIKTLDDIGITNDIAETGTTLIENARIKAHYLHSLNKTACFADDTGLEVDALNGAPGVYSARYAGEECNSSNNIDKLLHELQNVNNRSARFKTVIIYIDNNGMEHSFEGIVEGQIIKERRGTDGFGYDPIFVPNDSKGLTFAQLSTDEKNKISHRGKAIRKLVAFLSAQQ